MAHRQERNSVPMGNAVKHSGSRIRENSDVRCQPDSEVSRLRLRKESSTDSRPWLSPVATPWLKHNLNAADPTVSQLIELLNQRQSEVHSDPSQR